MSNTISATTPTVVNATYNLWCVSSLRISGDGCVSVGQLPAQGQTSPTPQPVSVAATMQKYRVLSDGVTAERSPLPTDVTNLYIPDVYAFIASGDPQASAVATAMGAILAALAGYGTEQAAL